MFRETCRSLATSYLKCLLLDTNTNVQMCSFHLVFVCFFLFLFLVFRYRNILRPSAGEWVCVCVCVKFLLFVYIYSFVVVALLEMLQKLYFFYFLFIFSLVFLLMYYKYRAENKKVNLEFIQLSLWIFIWFFQVQKICCNMTEYVYYCHIEEYIFFFQKFGIILISVF